MFGPLAKWVAEIDHIERIPEYISRAFHVAKSGRPGPVVLALPENVLSAEADVKDIAVARPARQMVSYEQVSDVIDRLKMAQNPMVVAGGSLWTKKAAKELGLFAAALGLPSRRRFDVRILLIIGIPILLGILGSHPIQILLRRSNPLTAC